MLDFRTVSGRRRLQRFLDTQFAQTVLALLFTAGCVALVIGFTRLVHGDSAIGWITRGVNALWRGLGLVCVLCLITAGAVDARAQTHVLRGDSDRVDIMSPRGMWTGVGETPRHPLAPLAGGASQQGNEITGNFIAPDGTLRHCIVQTDGQGAVLSSECP